VLYALPYTYGHSYSCGLFTRPCSEVTRDSLDFSRSLRGLSCLLQKHRLRYTIKPPSLVRGPCVSFGALSRAPSSPLFVSHASLAHTSFSSSGFTPAASCRHCSRRRRCRRGLVSRHATRDTTVENAEAISSLPLTIRARLVFLLYSPFHYLRAIAPFLFLRRVALSL